MAEWIEPIYDRTQADVDYAKAQLNAKNNINELKGCFNLSDMRRIENNARYLADELIKLYYFNKINTNSWNMSDVPYTAHINGIINNVSVLWEKYEVPVGSVSLPSTMLHYEHINAIEKNHYLLKKHIDNMVSSFRECNDGLECEEE